MRNLGKKASGGRQFYISPTHNVIDEIQYAFNVCSICFVSLMLAVVESKRSNTKMWGRIVKYGGG